MDLKRSLMTMAALVWASLALVSCGAYSPPGGGGTTNRPSALQFRAFVSNPLQATGNGPVPLLNIVDASKDVLSNAAVPLFGVVAFPKTLALSADRHFTLVYSSSDNSLAVIDNQTERQAASGTTQIPAMSLAGQTDSALYSQSGALIFAAVPSAPVTGQSPGTVEVFSSASGTKVASVAVPAAHFLAQGHTGNRVLVLSDNNLVTSLTPANIGTNNPVATAVGTTFDRPVWAAFSTDDSTAYVLNCGPECGGTQASIVALNMNATPPALIAGSQVNVDAGTVALLTGTLLYVAGTPPGQSCAGAVPATSAAFCGTASVVDLTSRTVRSKALIADGYHTRMEMGSNNQLFVGASTCTSVSIPSGETRGCLSIVNVRDPMAPTVVAPPQLGDATGIAPITGRNMVYVAQNGNLWIYDTTTDKLSTTQIDIIGQVSDVKLVDQ